MSAGGVRVGWQEKLKDSAFIAVKTDFRSFVFSFSDHYLNVAIREFTGKTHFAPPGKRRRNLWGLVGLGRDKSVIYDI